MPGAANSLCAPSHVRRVLVVSVSLVPHVCCVRFQGRSVSLVLCFADACHRSDNRHAMYRRYSGAWCSRTVVVPSLKRDVSLA